MRLSSLREDQILRISDEGNDETRAWLQRNVAEIDECSARIAELEALLDRARYVLANNAAEGDATAGVLVNDINAAMTVRT